MIRAVTATIDLQALRFNLAQLRQRVSQQVKIMCVVKADAYGHGMARVANTLEDESDAFAVATMEEGIALRHEGIAKPITVLQGFRHAEDLTQCIILKLNPVVHQEWQITLLEAMAKQTTRSLSIWIKITSGMNRIGFYPDELDKVWQRLSEINFIEETRLMTHMARADEQTLAKDDSDNPTRRQIETFAKACDCYQTEKSLANSATLLDWPEAHADWVRPGLSLYGINPFATGTADELGLKPVMTLTAPLIATYQRKKGDALGYAGSYVCPKDMLIGVVQIGYGDGYPRHAKNGTPVLINAHKSHIVGRVSMDSILIDLTDINETQISDKVTLWGEGLPIETIAACADTIPYELLCNVFGRVKYDYE